MPNFKEFIKGFEEPEQPKGNRDQIIEKVNQKMMNAGTYGALGDKENYEKSIAEAEELRKGLAPKAEQPKQKPSVGSGSYKGVNIVSTPSGYFIKDEKNSTQYSFETMDKAKEYIDNAEKAEAEGGMFDQSGLVTEKGKAASDEFKREKGIENYHSLSNDQFNALAKEAMEKYGIKDFELAQEFLISNSEDDKDLNKLLEMRRKPKPGSFGKMIEGFDEKEKTNEEKARELANAPETEQSFNRIYADLNKGFEETYKRKPTQDEMDAIRDIARLQTALVVMATKK